VKPSKNLSSLLELEAYTSKTKKRDALFFQEMKYLVDLHRESSESYKKLCDEIFRNAQFEDISNIPFLPVGIFKNSTLLSIKSVNLTKKVSSSGTSNQKKSEIIIDRETSMLQRQILSKQLRSILGPTRFPLVVFDKESMNVARNEFSARTAGIRGFSLVASEIFFAINEDNSMKDKEFREFLQKNKRVILFGFTWKIWEALEMLEATGKSIDFPLDSVLVHGGGWKKLENLKISKQEFSSKVNRHIPECRVINYYGMVEQAGSIYFECKLGFLHSSSYADVIVRDSTSFNVAPLGQLGLIQVMSLAARSYPGHSLLTEDLGTLFGRDDCNCGLSGAYFHVFGRVKNVELRGCSDAI
jgi:hypothetical protein